MHALKVGFSKSQDFLIDSRESNYTFSFKETFSSLDLSRGPSIHIRDNSQIPAIRKGSIKIGHGDLLNVLYVPSLA